MVGNDSGYWIIPQLLCSSLQRQCISNFALRHRYVELCMAYQERCITMTSWWARWHLKHQPHDYLFTHLVRHRWKKTSKLCITGLCGPVTWKMFPYDDFIMDYLVTHGFNRHVYSTEAVVTKNHWQIASWVIKASLYNIRFVLHYFLHINIITFFETCRLQQNTLQLSPE